MNNIPEIDPIANPDPPVSRPLRVYRDTADEAGVVLCVAHRRTFFRRHLASFGAGEYGGHCEHCVSQEVTR